MNKKKYLLRLFDENITFDLYPQLMNSSYSFYTKNIFNKFSLSNEIPKYTRKHYFNYLREKN